MIGQALGAGAVGALSDWLGPGRLSTAVLLVCAFAGLGALAIFAWTARQMRASASLAVAPDRG